jgi:lysozyme
MIASTRAVSLIKESESYAKKLPDGRCQAYQDSVGVWTIGWGSTFYPDGTKVKEGDIRTEEEANQFLTLYVQKESVEVNALLTISPKQLNQNQFDALVDFAYNLGIGALKSSTLLKKVLVNPSDPEIRMEFMKWTKAGGRVLPGLVVRRKKEADLYFKSI